MIPYSSNSLHNNDGSIVLVDRHQFESIVYFVGIGDCSGCAPCISSLWSDPRYVARAAGTDAVMSRFIAVATCGLLVSGCSSWMPTIDMSAFKPAPAVAPTDMVRVESNPPGADARAGTGAACRTPCTLGVPLADGNVTIALNGYVPQTVAVQLVNPGDARPDTFNSSAAHVTPNPLYVELEPAPPPPPPVAMKRPPPKKPHVASKPKPTLAQSALPEPQSAAPPPPAQPALAPWPEPR
jgi:PEGA domain